jgi:23S rRNA (cytidine1920-2'-O)/16S rRNA (cytidine1409-2'-O)-methyltransferase
MEDERLDLLLVRRGLVSSRTEAQRLISADRVTVEGESILRPNKRVSHNSSIHVDKREEDFVSRAGHKLDAALTAFKIDPTDAHCLDIGISTGGFTDCLLKRGAASVCGIDVGHGQLHPTLHSDPRVELREGVNARSILLSDFSTQFSIITIDVSFISLSLILPNVCLLLSQAGKLICLIKPQFEVGQGKIGKNGIVVNETFREVAREKVHTCANSIGLRTIETMQSPIVGGDGNIEYLSLFELQS